MPSLGRTNAEIRYSAARSHAMALAEENTRRFSGATVQLTHIDPAALAAAALWKSQYRANGRGAPQWNWEQQYRKFRRRARRIELAIWSGRMLCGLALGRVSDHCIVASIHLLEGKPTNNVLRGKLIVIATRYLEILAVDLNCAEASLELPHPALINYFKRLGYEKEVKKGSRVVRLKKHLGAQFADVQNGGQS